MYVYFTQTTTLIRTTVLNIANICSYFVNNKFDGHKCVKFSTFHHVDHDKWFIQKIWRWTTLNCNISVGLSAADNICILNRVTLNIKNPRITISYHYLSIFFLEAIFVKQVFFNNYFFCSFVFLTFILILWSKIQAAEPLLQLRFHAL